MKIILFVPMKIENAFVYLFTHFDDMNVALPLPVWHAERSPAELLNTHILVVAQTDKDAKRK